MKTTLEILKAARELIAEPSGWTQGVFARNEVGQNVSANASSARCFCSVGAMIRVCSNDDFDGGNYAEAHLALRVAFNDVDGSSDIASFNDNHTHAEVLVGWDEAIARLEAA